VGLSCPEILQVAFSASRNPALRMNSRKQGRDVLISRCITGVAMDLRDSTRSPSVLMSLVQSIGGIQMLLRHDTSDLRMLA
jgi:hypothetical protein